MKTNWIIFKSKYKYSSTKTIMWSNTVLGPYTDEGLEDVLKELRSVKRLGDIKDIKILVNKYS